VHFALGETVLGATSATFRVFARAARVLLQFCVSLVTVFCYLTNTAFAQDSLCAEVKIEIKQKVSLERQAFDAVMKINNGLDASSLTGISVNLTFKDANGLPVVATTDANNIAATFFLRLDSLDGVGAIDGSGVVAPKTSGTVKWLIIPSAGAGGLAPAGQTYRIGGTLTYTLEGETKTVTVSPETITVKPQPQLILDYFLAGDVYADDAFTPETEPPVPFTLGVRVKNVGGGTANKLKIETAQPKIIDNQQGLAIAFQIINGYVNDISSDKTLLLNFGDIASSSAKIGRWDMTTTLSGRFTELAATFTHDDSLGGALTSLLKEVNTYILVRDVKVDLPGRDNIRDFLALDGATLKVFESEGQNTAVSDFSSGATLTSSTGGNYRLRFNATAGLAYVKVADPNNGGVQPGRITRSDGKVLLAENIWLSKKRNPDNSWAYSVNFFDANSTGDYTVELLPAGQLASLSGQVFVDGNNNGTRDSGEPALGLVRIDLQGTGTGNASFAVSATSDANGAFTFSQLLPGTYRMTAASIAGYTDGTNTAGSAGGVVSTNVISEITIAAGMTATGYRFAKRTLVANAADLVSSLNVGSGVIVQGSNATITAKVKNVGPATGTNARATIVLPTGLTFVSAVPMAGTYNNVTGVWTIGDSIKDAEPTLTITARVDDYKAYTLSIVATSDTPDPVAGNNSATTTLNPVALQQSDIRVLVTPTASVAASGSSVSYVVDVSNFGPDAASNLTVAITLPANLASVSTDASSGTFVNGVWSIGDIANLGAANLIIRGNLTDTGPASLTAVLSSIQSTDTNAANNTATGAINLASPSADLALTIAASKATLAANETSNLTVGLTNNGPFTVTAATVSVAIPPELVVVSSAPSAGTFDPSTATWAAGSVPAGATPSLLVVVRSPAGSPAVVVGRVSTPSAEPTLSNNEVKLPINGVLGGADIVVSQRTDSPSSPNVILRTSVTNNSALTANNLRVVGGLPNGVTASSTTATRGLYDATTGVWTIPTLAIGEVVTLELTIPAQLTVARMLVVVSDKADPNAANNVSVLQAAVPSNQAYCVPTTAIADATTAASFRPFGTSQGLEVRSGRPAAADWEWGLGTNTQNASSFQNINNVDWPNGRVGGDPVKFTLTYNANGNGVITLFNGSTNAQLATKTFVAPAAPATGLRVGNAIRFWVKSNAGIGVGAKIEGVITEIDGVLLATPITLETNGSDKYDNRTSIIALAQPANAGTLVVKGQMRLSWPGAASAIPTGSRLNATISAGTISCGSSGLANRTSDFGERPAVETGAGIAGSIAVAPSEIPQGENIAFTYRITNDGDSDTTNTPVRVTLANASGQVVQTLTHARNLMQGTTINASQSWIVPPTQAAGEYKAKLEVILGNSVIALGETDFEVKPRRVLDTSPLVTPTSQSGLLVLVSCADAAQTSGGDNAGTANCLQSRLAFVQQYLAGIGIATFTVTSTEDEFVERLRSGKYNTYWIAGGADKLPRQIAEEVSEAVLRGDALIVDGSRELLGTDYGNATGLLSVIPLSVVADAITLSGTIGSGSVNVATTRHKVAVQAGSEVVGRFSNDDPAIIAAEYGRGKTMFFAFDLVAALQAAPEDTGLASLLNNALAAVRTGSASSIDVRNSRMPTSVSMTTDPRGADRLWQLMRPTGLFAEIPKLGLSADQSSQSNWGSDLVAFESRKIAAAQACGKIDRQTVVSSISETAVGLFCASRCQFVLPFCARPSS
jgi:uncharacterized repeat protein (TIGR01451 family)